MTCPCRRCSGAGPTDEELGLPTDGEIIEMVAFEMDTSVADVRYRYGPGPDKRIVERIVDDLYDEGGDDA